MLFRSSTPTLDTTKKYQRIPHVISSVQIGYILKLPIQQSSSFVYYSIPCLPTRPSQSNIICTDSWSTIQSYPDNVTTSKDTWKWILHELNLPLPIYWMDSSYKLHEIKSKLSRFPTSSPILGFYDSNRMFYPNFAPSSAPASASTVDSYMPMFVSSDSIDTHSIHSPDSSDYSEDNKRKKIDYNYDNHVQQITNLYNLRRFLRQNMSARNDFSSFVNEIPTIHDTERGNAWAQQLFRLLFTKYKLVKSHLASEQIINSIRNNMFVRKYILGTFMDVLPMMVE